MEKRTFRILALIWAAIMIAALSSTATLLILGKGSALRPARVVTQQEYDTIARYRRLEEVRSTLVDNYYVPLDEEALLLGAVRGMTGAVNDPYTFYYTPEEMRAADENAAGAYRGIGILIQPTEEGWIEVLRVYPNTPAEAVGIRVGDVIVAVDGEAISGEDGRTYNDAVEMIRGQEGTTVDLTLHRDGETLEVTVDRADVNVSYVEFTTLPGNIGYIAISQFTGDAQERFMQAIDAFKSQAVAGLVIDVRSNPGGLLDQVVAIADSLLPKGVIVYTQDRSGARVDYYSDEDMYDVPLVVLTNESSASASEILAASVQALNRGVVVGLKTYGKGIVQTLSTFEIDGAGIQYTSSSYYDANGRSIHGVGVTPDIEVALEGDSIPLNPDPFSDNQLARALEALNDQIAARGKAGE